MSTTGGNENFFYAEEKREKKDEQWERRRGVEREKRNSVPLFSFYKVCKFRFSQSLCNN